MVVPFLHRTCQSWACLQTTSTRLAHHCSCGPVKLGPTDVPSGGSLTTQTWPTLEPAPTAMTDVSKSILRDQQLAATLAAIEDTSQTDIQVYTDGSTHEGTTDGGAGMVVMSGEDIIERWHAPTGRWSSSYQAENSAMVRAISWLDEYEDWQSALVLCDSKSLVEILANSNQPDGDVHRIQSAIAELCKKKEVRILWVPGHCNLRGNKLADLEAKLSSTQHPLGFVDPRCTHPPRRKAVAAHPSSLDCFIHDPTPRRRRSPPKSRPNRPHPIPLRTPSPPPTLATYDRIVGDRLLPTLRGGRRVVWTSMAPMPCLHRGPSTPRPGEDLWWARAPPVPIASAAENHLQAPAVTPQQQQQHGQSS